MKIGAAQLEQLRLSIEDAFWEKMFTRVHLHFSKYLIEVGRERFQELRRACELFGIVTERGRFGFVCMGYLIGKSFPWDATFRETFTTVDSLPDETVEALYEQVAKQLENHET